MICGFVKDHGNTSVKISTCYENLQIAYCENYRNLAMAANEAHFCDLCCSLGHFLFDVVM